MLYAETSLQLIQLAFSGKQLEEGKIFMKHNYYSRNSMKMIFSPYSDLLRNFSASKKVIGVGRTLTFKNLGKLKLEENS